MSSWEDISQGLVCSLEILLDGNMVLNLKEDDWSGAKEGQEEKSPVGGELVHVWEWLRIQGPHDSCTSGLNTFVEPDEVGGFTARVG